MLDKNVAVSVLNTQALARAKINAENFKNGIDKKLKYGESKCARYVKKALIAGGASAKNSGIESAKNYGPWLLENNFKVVDNATTVRTGGVFIISGQQVGDVVVIQAAPHHVHGHMAMFNGTHWVSDFVQERGFYPAQIYRDQNIPYPPREIITQWRETDLQFIQRILSEVGIYWRTMMDDVRSLDTYIFADSQLHYQFDARLPYSEPSGLFDGAAESVWDVRTWHNIATGTVTTRDYNYRTATTPMDAAVSVRSDAVTTGEHYRYAAPYREAGDDASPEPETESGAFYARLHHERELNRSARIHLFSNAAHLTPGQVLEPQGDVITALKEGVILTLVTFRGARDSRLHVSVWGLPYTERYCFRPAEIPRPVIPGTLPARIESREKNDTYAHLDEQGR